MDDFLMKPKVDFAFKEIMLSEPVRIGFIAATIHIDPKRIKSAVILNTDLRKVHEDDKLGILDVNVRLDDGTEIDIEIQLTEMLVWPDRSAFYLAKKFVDQIKEGQSYNVLKKCISISILDFKLFKNENSFYSCFHIMEDTRHFIYTNKLEFHVIELPKLPKELKEDSSDLLLWAKFFAAEKKEEFEMLSAKNKYIDQAYQRLQVISQDDKKRMEYDAREKAIRDHMQFMLEATERGREEERKKNIKTMLKFASIEQVAHEMNMSIEEMENFIQN